MKELIAKFLDNAKMLTSTNEREIEMAKLTKAQESGMIKLKAGNFSISRGGNLHVGVNTRTLWSLKELGLIDFSKMFSGGNVSHDFKIIKQQITNN